MVKGSHFPLVGLVTSLATGHPVHRKLSVVYIRMAGGAVSGQAGELLVLPSVGVFPEMAAPAGRRGMSSAERESGLSMVECHPAPGSRVVAAFARGSGVIARVDGRGMNVGMTIGTSGADIPEVPFHLLFMTRKTWRGQMGTGETECRAVVPFDGERRTGESLCGVAAGTIPRFALPGELAIVIVGMAIGTLLMPDRSGKTGLVARLTGHHLMFVLKRECRLRMIELT
jgi:hypothetical protein